MHRLPLKYEMVEMISEYVDDASLISFQFSTKWKSIVMAQTGNKIGDEIIWLLVKIVIRDQFGRTYNFQSLKGRNAGGNSKWWYLSKFLLSETNIR